jgi:hypothetical protein
MDHEHGYGGLGQLAKLFSPALVVGNSGGLRRASLAAGNDHGVGLRAQQHRLPILVQPHVGVDRRDVPRLCTHIERSDEFVAPGQHGPAD